MKALRFVGSSLDDLKNFPADARRDAGFELDAVQRGLMPTDFKPILAVGPGAYEIRVRVLGEWRDLCGEIRTGDLRAPRLPEKDAENPQGRHGVGGPFAVEYAARRYKQIGD